MKRGGESLAPDRAKRPRHGDGYATADGGLLSREGYDMFHLQKRLTLMMQ